VSSASERLKADSLEYHELPRPGKLSVELTKPAQDAHDLTLAYSPGVASPVLEIDADPENAFRYTNKGNLVAVISNGTAILGLGDRGALASKPVMEGKGVLFRRFAGIDVFDIEVATKDPEEFVKTVSLIADTFGGINLEDIAAPEAFEIERRLIEACDIPVFHDDQHGTAVIGGAALLNALEIKGKTIEDARIVTVGAGAAGISVLRHLVDLGAKREHITLVDSRGVVHSGRVDLNQYKQPFAIETDARTLEDALAGADVFIGVSQAGLLTPDMLRSMADGPIVFALANPDPEITPEDALATRDDVIIATGRSDYPNQVNNVLGFPFIFRGALDVRARRINTEMKIAATHALRDLAKLPVPVEVEAAYGGQHFRFGPDYIIPKPLDPRLLGIVATAVAQAAIDTGVARKPLPANYPLTSVDAIWE